VTEGEWQATLAARRQAFVHVLSGVLAIARWIVGTVIVAHFAWKYW
jgi:hypothetical protein